MKKKEKIFINLLIGTIVENIKEVTEIYLKKHLLYWNNQVSYFSGKFEVVRNCGKILYHKNLYKELIGECSNYRKNRK